MLEVQKEQGQAMEDFIPMNIRIEHFRDYNRAVGIDLRPYQLDFGWMIIKSVVRNAGEEILASWARQSGKTETVAAVSYFLASCLPTVYKMKPYVDRGVKIGIFAPKKEQADISFNRTKEKFAEGVIEDLLGLSVEINNGNTFLISNKSVIHCSTGSKKATVEGYTFDLVFIEEAEDFYDLRLKKSIFPMLSATNGTRVLIGTPTPERKGYFYERLKHSKKKFLLDYTEAVAYSDKYRNFIEKEKKALGENSDEFRSQYLLEWPSSNLSFIEDVQLFKIRGGRIEESCSKPCSYGIDVGEVVDPSIITVMCDGRILNWLELSTEEYKKQRDLITAFLSSYRLESGYIDANGPGRPLYSFLCESPEIKKTLRPFDVNLQSKSEGYSLLRQELLRDDCPLSYPSDECVSRFKFENEVLALEKTQVGKIMKISKPKGKKYHDDYPDSWMLAFLAGKEKRKAYSGYGVLKR